MRGAGGCPQLRSREWRTAMSEAGQGTSFRCLDLARATRRDVLALASVIGASFAPIPVLAQPASERPKEGDLLVSIESETTDALALEDIPTGGPPVLAWPMDPADKTVRKESR